MKITVVFDEAFGSRLEPSVGDAFWLVESPANRALAERLWSAGEGDPDSAVFRRSDGPADLADLLDTVELHHPQWSEIEVVGAPLTDGVRQIANEDDLRVVLTDDGFRLSR